MLIFATKCHVMDNIIINKRFEIHRLTDENILTSHIVAKVLKNNHKLGFFLNTNIEIIYFIHRTQPRRQYVYSDEYL